MTRKALAAAAVALTAMPGSALAADSTSVVSGSIGSELSLSVATPTPMVMTHATPGTATSLVTVTSTAPSWTLSVSDQAATTPGYMDRVTGTGPSSLANPLEWKLSTGSTYTSLSGTPTTVTTGSLVGTALVDYRQPLGASENLVAADTYSLTVTYTVT